MKKNLTKYLSIILGCLFYQISHAQNTIHVYSLEIPWVNQTITKDPNKLYSIKDAISSANAGDEIVIHEGVYREKVVVNKNNLTLKNFENDYVLISGARVISGWVDATGMSAGVKVADISGINIETDYSQLFADGEIQYLGRHPNNLTGAMMDPLNIQSGYAPIKTAKKDAGGNGQVTFEGTTLPNVNLNGGIVRGLTGKMRNYFFGDIVSSSGNTVSFNAINNGPWKNNAAIGVDRHKFSWGFVMHKNLVDSPGEWFIDGNQLFYFPKEGQNINETRVEIQVREKVLVLNNTTDVILDGLNFVAGNVDMNKVKKAKVINSSFRYLYPFWTPGNYTQPSTEKKGVYLLNSEDNLFENVYAGHTWANMFTVDGGKNNTFKNCVIEDLGWIGIFTSSIFVKKGDNTNINNCTFGDAGRFQIRVSNGNAKVNILDSDFYSAMMMGEDAGPVEATSTGRIGALDMKGSEIAYNKVHDHHGIPVSDQGYTKQKIVAFYMEDTENYTAHHNLVYNIKANTYNGPHQIEREGEFLYMGPRYNAMAKPVNYYNNTIWNYDKAIGVWNIKINNWQELGLPENRSVGKMDDGHFANNIFVNNTTYSMLYSIQNLNTNGSKRSNVGVNNNANIKTNNFITFTDHMANWGFQYNPENNVFFNLDSEATNFEDAQNGDFKLKSGSSAIDAGKVLSGITSSNSPDAGALEGSDRVLNAGAQLILPNFLEEGDIIIAPNEDEVSLLNVPQKLPSTTTYTFEVAYSANVARDLVVSIFKGTDWKAGQTILVNPGRDTTEVTVNVDPALIPGTDYEIRAIIREVGGDFSTNIYVDQEPDLEVELVTSLEDESQQNGLFIYPNPASSAIHISDLEEGIDWKVMSLHGEFMMNGKSDRIDLSNLANGSYYLEFSNGIKQKIIKLK